jgi:hypothetical protein
VPDFSVILQSPQVRAVVQENLLEKAFHDALFPRTLFRSEVTPTPWPAGVGDTQIFSAPGLMPVDARPLTPGDDPDPDTYPTEQWTAQLNQYAKSIDTHMPSSMVAIANLFLRNAHQLGMQAAQTLNRIVRNRMYGAALAGWTNLTAVSTTAVIRVARLNGFTRARNPNLATGSQVKFDYVSSTNPLGARLFDNGAEVGVSIIGFTPDTPGDEVGPGTLTLSAAVTNASARAYLFSNDATSIVRSGGGTSIDSLTATTDVPTLADVRTAVADFWMQNVPEHPDSRFHAHLDPVSQAKIFADQEFQRLLTAMPDYYMYKQFALGELLNTVFLRNSECPVTETVVGGNTYDARDPFPGELVNAAGNKVHRILFSAQGGIFEYYSDLNQLLTDAGVNGKVGEPRIVNNGIEVYTDRIQLIIRSPQNRLQDKVSTSWKFIGDWPTRTDAAVGSAARYKRFKVIEHTE